MNKTSKSRFQSASPYNSAITRDQFLFYEMRQTAKLITEGLSNEEIINKIVKENLFQYPTEKSLRRMTNTCLKRLEILNNSDLINAIVFESSKTAKQICLYAMMKQYKIVWDFMISVIGEKYRSMNMHFSKLDVNIFFMRLQEQDDVVASWSDSTVERMKRVIVKMLVDNEYLDNNKSSCLNPVLISPILETAIRKEGRVEALPAFHCLDLRRN